MTIMKLKKKGFVIKKNRTRRKINVKNYLNFYKNNYAILHIILKNRQKNRQNLKMLHFGNYLVQQYE